MISQLIDSTIGMFSPKAQFRREVTRKSLAIAKGFSTRKFDAASFSGKTKGWYAPKTSSMVDTKLYLNTLRDRSRDLVRNAPVARRIIDVMTSNVIGSGIVPQINCEDEGRREKIEQLFTQFTQQCDFGGRLDFYGLQALCFRSMMECGETLVRFVRTTDEIPLKLQVLESDFIDSFKEGYLDDGLMCQGIEFAKDGGKPRAYWLYRNHPGGFLFNGFYGDSLRIPASEIIHCFREERPGQVRGIPILTPVMLKIRDLDQYSFAQLWRQKVSACYAAFVRDVTEQLDPVAAKDDDYLENLEPGTIEYLPPGREITFSSPPEAPNYPDYTRACLREIAAAIGASYEALSGDYSQVNFSSARMGWLEFHRTIQAYQWITFIPSFMTPITNEFLRIVRLKGIDTKGVTMTFTPPRREMIDPVDEVESMSAGIRNGFFSLSECIRELGFDPKERLTELSEDKKFVESLGLNLECFSQEGEQSGQNIKKSNTDSISTDPEEGRKKRDKERIRRQRQRRWG